MQCRQYIQKFGRIDFLINNAGIQRYGNVTDTTEDDWDLIMNVNSEKSIPLCKTCNTLYATTRQWSCCKCK
jgi:NAD(P)-dependent dehydrogenase (short-subunit alcohol dehydrogenase family)